MTPAAPFPVAAEPTERRLPPIVGIAFAVLTSVGLYALAVVAILRGVQ